MTQDALFGELRSLLQRPASTQTWDALCQHLDLWPHDTLQQVALPYALDLVTRWPDAVERATPKRWVERLLKGEDITLMALVNMLSLAGHQLTHAQLLALLAALQLKNITSLQIYNLIGDEGAKALANSPHLNNLTLLNLEGNEIGDDGAAALANSPYLKNLTSLYLNYNNIGDKGSAALANSTNLVNLKELSLYDNNIGAAGAAALANPIILKISPRFT